MMIDEISEETFLQSNIPNKRKAEVEWTGIHESILFSREEDRLQIIPY